MMTTLTRPLIRTAALAAVLFAAAGHAAAQETPAREKQPATPPAADEIDPAAKEKPAVDYVKMTVQLDGAKRDVYLELDRARAPITVENFLAYTDAEFFDGTIFHRVIANFMIQGGGFTADMQQKPTKNPIKNEWQNGLKNSRGTIAMARTASPDSATAQFFINVKDNPNLDQPISGGAGYAVFGKVVAGMDVIEEIRAVPTGRHPSGHSDVPRDPVIIDKVRRVTEDEAKKAIESERKAEEAKTE
jgi:peptidyl-prolyl cis-trans isomerase A (cyclophilin A)